MKKIGFLTILLSVVTIWAACNKDNLNVDTLLGKMSAKIDGTAWSVSATDVSNGIGGVAAMEASGKMLVTGVSIAGKTIAVFINGNSEGTYDLAPMDGESNAVSLYRVTTDKDTSNYYSTGGSVVISSKTDTRISGTFNFVAAKNTTESINITEGSFENVIYKSVDSLSVK